MLLPCSAYLVYTWVVLICYNVRHVASLTGGKEVDSTNVRTFASENVMDIWVPQFIFNHETVCTGVTLSLGADLTSATCLSGDEPLDAFVVVQNHGWGNIPVQVANVDRCIKFSEKEQQLHNLMVCFHRCQWTFNYKIFVPLLNLQWDRMPNEFNEKCNVMGFGHLTADGDKCNVLHTMEMHVGTLQKCGSQEGGLQNYICARPTEEQASCDGDGGEPLLCQYNTSEYLVHGISKQGDCSAPQVYRKFIYLGYYREWLERTVPDLLSATSLQKLTSLHGEEEGNGTTGVNRGDLDPGQNLQKRDYVEDHSLPQREKCPVIPHPPSVHVHKLSSIKEKHFGITQRALENDKDKSSNSVTHSKGGQVLDSTGLEVNNAGKASEKPTDLAEVPLPNQQDSSGITHSVSVAATSHDPNLLEASTEGDRSAYNVKLSATATSVPGSSSDTILSGSYEASVTNDRLPEESLTTSTPSKDCNSGNGGIVTASDLDTSSISDEFSSNATLPQLSSTHDRLRRGWYHPNAARAAAHSSGSNEPLNLEQINKAILDNEPLLNFTFLRGGSLPGTNLSSFDNQYSTNGTVLKVHPSADNDLPKLGNVTPGNKQYDVNKPISPKSLKEMEKSSQVSIDTNRTDNIKPQDMLPADGSPHSHETGQGKPQVTSENPAHTASSSISPLRNSVTMAQPTSKINRTAVPGTLMLKPSEWDWLRRNGLRIPKNPLKNSKILGTNLLFKHSRDNYGANTRDKFAQKYRQRKQKQPDSNKLGVAPQYRDIRPRQVMSNPQQLMPLYNFKTHSKSTKFNSSHPHSNGMPKNSVPGRTALSENFMLADSVAQVSPSGYHNRLKDDISLMLSHPHDQWPKGNIQKLPEHSESNKQNDLKTQKMPLLDKTDDPLGNVPNQTVVGIEQTVLSRDGKYTRSASLAAEPAKSIPLSSSFGYHSQPEGTFTGVLSSSIRNQQKRSNVANFHHDAPQPFDTDSMLLADLVNWPMHFGLKSSQLTPPVSFLTAVRFSEDEVRVFPTEAIHWYQKLLKAFLPGGNYARRVDMYKKTLIWGPPIVYNEFEPLKVNLATKHKERDTRVEVNATDGRNRLRSIQYQIPQKTRGTKALPPRLLSDLPPARQARDIKNVLLPYSGADNQHGNAINDTATALKMKNESHTAENNRTSYNRSPNHANISHQLAGGIPMETVETGKQMGLPSEESNFYALSSPDKDATMPPIQNDGKSQGQPEFYGNIKL